MDGSHRVDAFQAVEPSEIVVRRMDDATLLQCDRGQMGVAGEVARAAAGAQQAAQDQPVLFAGRERMKCSTQSRACFSIASPPD